MLACDPTALIHEARARTKLHQFATEDFMPALNVLLKAMRDEADLTDEGMAWQLEEHVEALSVRLQMDDWIARHPEILHQQVRAPVVIVGLQRSGTSMLFRSIASDPKWNVLRTWQALRPVPLSERPSEGPDPRIALAEKWCAERQWMQHIHAFHALAPEMEALLLKQSFMINHPSRLVPSHRTWCEKADFVPVYRHLKRQLQFLQWQNGWAQERRWILKTPAHLLSLDALVRVFPDAVLVMTHRHPAASVGSMLSLVRLAQSRSARTVNIDLIRSEWLRILTLSIERFLEFSQAQSDRFVHIAYRSLLEDPLGAIRQIYAHAGMRFDVDSAAAVTEWVGQNPRHKDGKHEYSLSDFGLTEAQIERLFAPYLDRFAAMLQ